jgi:demethylsterigmatocystin 6-O-methyltransferase
MNSSNILYTANLTDNLTGAKFYYLKGVIHELPDEKAVLVLKSIVPALGQDSVILIDEKIFPDSHVDWKMSQLDISMMACFSSIERTEAMWNTILDLAGLKVARKYIHGPESYDGVLVVVPK